jgi:hypothetical protein
MISLRGGLGLSAYLNSVIDELIEQKTCAIEQGMAARAPEFDNFMAHILDQPAGQMTWEFTRSCLSETYR